jgi:SAM-dependent methyltransferase
MGDESAARWYPQRTCLTNPEEAFSDLMVGTVGHVALGIPPGATVLEIACGDGFFTRHVYARRAARIVALDFCAEALGVARTMHAAPNIEYVHANIEDYQPEESAFDVVVCRGGLPVMSSLARQCTVAVVIRALRVGGLFVGDSNDGFYDLVHCASKFDPLFIYEYPTSGGRINYLWRAVLSCK